jgi:hypothetical protein
MNDKTCEACGLDHKDEVLQHALNAVTLLKAETVKDLMRNSNQSVYAEAIETVIAGWRGHALPACDPLALA